MNDEIKSENQGNDPQGSVSSGRACALAEENRGEQNQHQESQPSTRKKTCGVYCWTHIGTGRKYVGSSVNCERRKKDHECKIRKGNSACFHREASRLGLQSFRFEILETCAPHERFDLEAVYIARLESVFPNGFNVHRDPTKFSDAYEWSNDRRAANSAMLRIVKNTPESRAKNSASAKARWASPQARAELSVKLKARLGTPEARAAASARQKIVKCTPEARAAQSARLRAYFSNSSARAAASEAQKKRFNSPEQRASASRRAREFNSKPESRAAASARTKAQFSRQEARDAASARTIAQLSTPEAREKISTALKKAVGTPEARAANTARQKAFYLTPRGIALRAAHGAKCAATKAAKLALRQSQLFAGAAQVPPWEL